MQRPSIPPAEWYDLLFVVHLMGCTLDEARRAYLAKVAEAALRAMRTRPPRKVIILLCGGETDPALPGVTEAGVAEAFLASLQVPLSLMRQIHTNSGVEHIRAVTAWVHAVEAQHPNCGLATVTVYYDRERWAVRRGYRYMLRFLYPASKCRFMCRFMPLSLGRSSAARRAVLLVANLKMLAALRMTWLDRISQRFIQWARRRSWRLVR